MESPIAGSARMRHRLIAKRIAAVFAEVKVVIALGSQKIF
jgi:hypothetical protein